MSSVLVKITKRRDHSGTGMQQLAEMSELVFFFFPFPIFKGEEGVEKVVLLFSKMERCRIWEIQSRFAVFLQKYRKCK